MAAVAASLSLTLGIARDSSSAAAAPGGTPRLNVVVIVSDDERFDANRRMRNVQLLLGREGVTFDRYYTTTSECCPSRASILTGQYPHHTGVVANFGPAGYPSFDESSTLATWLHDAGYTTALVGKYLNGYTLDGNHHVPPGWDRWVAIDSVPEERYYRYTLNEDGHLVDFGRRPADYSTSVLTSKAVDFVRTTRESRSSSTSRPSHPTFPRSLRRATARASTGCRRSDVSRVRRGGHLGQALAVALRPDLHPARRSVRPRRGARTAARDPPLPRPIGRPARRRASGAGSCSAAP